MSDGLTEGEEQAAAFAEGSGDPVWDDWDNPPRVPEIPVLHLDGFDGPMDLLLDLAERQRIDFGRMSVLALAEQFAAPMERLVGRVPLEAARGLAGVGNPLGVAPVAAALSRQPGGRRRGGAGGRR